MTAAILRRAALAAALLVSIHAATFARGQTPAVGRRFYAAGAASALVDRGLMLPAPAAAEAAAFMAVPAPSSHNVQNVAQATLAPWVDSNAWRFARGLRKANYSQLPAGSAGLAAAEAFTFDAAAILNIDQADLDDGERMLRFLNALEQPRLPVMANIGVIDDGSAGMGELLNMLSRRNLLYRVVAGSEKNLDLIVRIGSPDFPKDSTSNPSDFAARVRAKLGDDRRLVRLYGTTTLIAHLTGDGRRARLYLLSYSRNRTQTGVRVRMLGQYRPVKVAAYGAAANAALEDVQHPGKTTEFSLPTFSTICVVDLEK